MTGATIDVDELRDPDIQMGALTGLDEIFTIYYDETNNIRRLHVRADGFNVRPLKIFVLGGVAHLGPARDLDFDSLRRALRLQPSTQDMKLEHVAKGDFLEILDQPKLTVYLQWLIDKNLIVHYLALDPLYWAVVDIIDSILAEARQPQLYAVHHQLKNTLYDMLRYNLEATTDLFQRYSFPDVGRERRVEFIEELLDWLEMFEEVIGDFDYMMLKGTLQIARTLDALPFLENETPNVLIDAFSHFYVKRFCLLKNAQHIADAEDVVRDAVNGLSFTDKGQPWRNFRFAISHDEVGIQISDVITGTLGKLFTYINGTDLENLALCFKTLSSCQRTNQALLRKLLLKAIAECDVFAQQILSHEDRHRFSRFMAI